jgi:hypothetical protein
MLEKQKEAEAREWADHMDELHSYDSLEDGSAGATVWGKGWDDDSECRAESSRPNGYDWWSRIAEERARKK